MVKTLIAILALLVSSTSQIAELQVEKSDIERVEYQDRNGSAKVKYVYRALVRNSGKDVVKVIEVQACGLPHGVQGAHGVSNALAITDCQTLYLSGRFLPGAASWSDPLTVDKGTETVRLVKIQTSEAHD